MFHNRTRLISDPKQVIDELIELEMFGIRNHRNKLSEIFISKSLQEFMDGRAGFGLVSDTGLDRFCMLTVLFIFCKVFRQTIGLCHQVKDIISFHIGVKLIEDFKHNDS